MSRKFLLLAGLAAILAGFLTKIFWPISSDPSALPPENLMPYFLFEGVLTLIAFGIGVAFIIFGYKALRTQDKGFGLAFWTYVSTAWIMVSWWPHENLHRVLEGNFQGLLLIEYFFHVTTYLAGVIVAIYLLKQFRR